MQPRLATCPQEATNEQAAMPVFDRRVTQWPGLSQAAKLTWHALRCDADDQGEVIVNAKMFASFLGVSPSSVRRHLDELHIEGLVEIDRRVRGFMCVHVVDPADAERLRIARADGQSLFEFAAESRPFLADQNAPPAVERTARGGMENVNAPPAVERTARGGMVTLYEPIENGPKDHTQGDLKQSCEKVPPRHAGRDMDPIGSVSVCAPRAAGEPPRGDSGGAAVRTVAGVKDAGPPSPRRIEHDAGQLAAQIRRIGGGRCHDRSRRRVAYVINRYPAARRELAAIVDTAQRRRQGKARGPDGQSLPAIGAADVAPYVVGSLRQRCEQLGIPWVGGESTGGDHADR